MSGDGDTSLNTDTEEKNNEEATKKPKSLPATEKEIEREEASEGEDEEEEDDKEKSLIVEGKRVKKTVKRLAFQMVQPTKEPLSFVPGKGEILGDIERIQLVVGKMKAANLKPLHKLLYNRPGTISSLKKNIRRFSGFTFEEESDQYKKKREILKRYKNAVLKTICGTLDIEKSGKNDDLISRIMTFLMKPKSSGKPLPTSKRKSQKAEKRKRKNTGSAKKAKSKGTTSAEILTESSSEEEEKDSKQSSGVDDQLSENTDETSPQPKRKPQKGGKKECSSAGSAKKKSKPKASMSALVLESSSEEEEGKDLSSEEDEPPKKVVKTEISVAKGKTQSTKLANVKKADSSQDSTKREQSTAKQENDSDDEPLIKMLKKPPTDNNLRDTLKKLLEKANLEEVTMKQICKKVYENYPDHDLTDRKDYIKKTVKELIS
ncbi:protein DEK-like [Huso huso]|uniref:Protein DEK-like n=1 Tax=Huso huso TaxID=61971 RepID=A0ABR1A3V2_HUSHU